MKHYGKFYIGGEWVDPIAQRPFELVDPATEEVFATVALGSAADVDRAVKAAKAAFPAFSTTSTAERSALLQRIIEGFEARQGEVHEALTQEMGAPVSLTAQTGAGLAALRQAVKTLETYAFEERIEGTLIAHEPIGVAGLITPWNWPIQLLCNKLASAIAAGCPVVVKPSEFTPVSALILTQIIHDAGTPAGVFNLVNGDGPEVGNAISTHEDIAMVTFTGSTRAGILVAEAAAGSVKRVTQELGGKSANLILPHADLQKAAEFNVTRGFSNSGQSCHSPTRLLVHEDQLDEVLDHLRDAVARHIRVGDPRDPETTHGPVVNRAQFETIQGYIETALSEGGELVTGGPGRPEGLEKGFFVQPTIIANVGRDDTIGQQEIFGMVTAVITYRNVEEAVDIANDTEYGLGAYVFGEEGPESAEICRRMRAGRVFFNGAPGNTAAPMGGYKKSGNGREMGAYGMEEFLEVKALFGL